MHLLYSADVLEEDVYKKLKCINFRMNFPRLIPAANQQQESEMEVICYSSADIMLLYILNGNYNVIIT